MARKKSTTPNVAVLFIYGCILVFALSVMYFFMTIKNCFQNMQKDVENIKNAKPNLDYEIDVSSLEPLLKKIHEQSLEQLTQEIKDIKVRLDNLSFKKEEETKPNEESKEKAAKEAEAIKRERESFPKDTVFFPINQQEWNKLPTFDEVIGMEDEKKALEDFLDYIKNMQNYDESKLGKVKAPQGVLFYGVPGTGKTFLTRALAKEAGASVAFYDVASGSFSCTYIGEGPEKVRNLFKDARIHNQKSSIKASIIFIDECEEAFKDLSGDGSNNSKDLANIVNQFKIELTSTANDPKKPILIVGATNHIHKVDNAIKSRLDYHIEVKVLNQLDRQKYLELMINKIRKNPYEEDAKKYLFNILNPLIQTFPEEERSNRRLEQMLEIAIRRTARQGKKQVQKQQIQEAFYQSYGINILSQIQRQELLSKRLKEFTSKKGQSIYSDSALQHFNTSLNSKIQQSLEEVRSNRLIEQFYKLSLQKFQENNQQNLNIVDIQNVYKEVYGELENLNSSTNYSSSLN